MAKRQQANVVLLDPVKGWHLTYRENPPGEPWRFAGALVHLCEMTEGELKPIEPPTKSEDSPERAYGAKYWPEVDPIYGTKQTWMEKLDRGLWLGALGILSLLIFLLFSALTG